MATNPYITPRLFKFLKDLSLNNNREWFEENKDRYESDVREPLLQFIRDFEPRLHAISPHFEASAKKSGGSLFRIYRDVRFAKDKRPYKENAGVQFRHERGRDVHAPGFYLHLAVDDVFAGAGMWRPDAESLVKVRKAIVREPDWWEAARDDKAFVRAWDGLDGDELQRPPRGFPADHPHIEDIKRTDFIATVQLNRKFVTAQDFKKRLAKLFETSAPFMQFLTEAVELDW
jgi:uncharacterized protein (TIGR02453 family)